MSKTAVVQQLIAQGQKKEALKIASDFRIGVTPEERKTMKRGYECFHYESTYRQMGVDTDKAIADAWTTLISLEILGF